MTTEFMDRSQLNSKVSMLPNICSYQYIDQMQNLTYVPNFVLQCNHQVNSISSCLDYCRITEPTSCFASFLPEYAHCSNIPYAFYHDMTSVKISPVPLSFSWLWSSQLANPSKEPSWVWHFRRRPKGTFLTSIFLFIF